MSEEKESIIKYDGVSITIISDDKSDYVNLTHLAKAYRTRKSIRSWMRNRQTLAFLCAWEKKNNPNFKGVQMDAIEIFTTDRDEYSIKNWVEKTNAIGIYTRKGATEGGTFAHKDIAIRFAGWLSPEFELFLVEKIQELAKIEEQKYSLQLLTHEQVLALVQLKEVFRYVVNQVLAEEANRDIFVAQSGAKNPYKEFNKYRNQILEIKPDIINERIRQYCNENKIALTGKIWNMSKREKILKMDSYESVRNAVWDFLQVKGEINSLNLANLVGDMIRIEKGEIFRDNSDDLFKTKQPLGEFTDLEKYMLEKTHLKSAREVITYREELEEKQKKQLSTPFNKALKGLLAVPPPKDDK